MKAKNKGTTTAKKSIKGLIKAEDFIPVWQQSGTSDEVAKKLSITKAQATSKAMNFRKKGVSLKLMSRGPSSPDWDKLATLAESFNVVK